MPKKSFNWNNRDRINSRASRKKHPHKQDFFLKYSQKTVYVILLCILVLIPDTIKFGILHTESGTIKLKSFLCVNHIWRLTLPDKCDKIDYVYEGNLHGCPKSGEFVGPVGQIND